MKTPITNCPGLISWMHPQNKALIRHVGTSLQASEMFAMLALDPDRFPDMADTQRLQLMPIRSERQKEKFIYSVVEDAEGKRQEPSRIDGQEYIDLLNQCEILQPMFCNEDHEWTLLSNKDRRRPNPDEHPDTPLGWFVQLVKIKD